MDAPEIKTEISREIHDHEVFFAFRNDSDAEAFINWWNTIGLKDFKRWTKVNEFKEADEA